MNSQIIQLQRGYIKAGAKICSGFRACRCTLLCSRPRPSAPGYGAYLLPRNRLYDEQTY